MGSITRIVNQDGGDVSATVRKGFDALIEHVAEKLRSCAKDDEFLMDGAQAVLTGYEGRHGESDEVDCLALIKYAMVVSFQQAALFAEETLAKMSLEIVVKTTPPAPAR